MLTALRRRAFGPDADADGNMPWWGSFDLKSFLLVGLICLLLGLVFKVDDFAGSRMVRQNSMVTPLAGIAGALGSQGAVPLEPRAILRQVTIIVILLLTTGFMFFLLHRHTSLRTLIVLAFAFIMILLGAVFGIYGPVDAFLAIKIDTLGLILGMQIISAVLDEAGFFNLIAYRMQNLTKTNITRIFVLVCLCTYLLSTFVNNLATIVVMVPMVLQLSAVMGVDPRPVVVCAVIASNLGGASTMIGDFPNMLIAAETGMGFRSFLVFMTPICLVLLGALLFFMRNRIALLTQGEGPGERARKIRKPQLTGNDRWAIRRGILVMCHCILLIMLSDAFSLRISAIALFAGMSVFLFCCVDRGRVVERVGFNELLFFVGLFIIVGALEASGLMDYISRGISILSLGRSWLLCLILMWSAALMAAFLNAAPTTLLFFPVVMGFTDVPPHHIIWWALSLGIVAGASATIFGATGGPVAASLVEKLSPRYGIVLPGGTLLTNAHFQRIGLPVMLVFLGFSSVYIVSLCMFL